MRWIYYAALFYFREKYKHAKYVEIGIDKATPMLPTRVLIISVVITSLLIA
jgi:hypothetical protein